MFERLEPSAGGLARLRLRMEAADRQSRLELRVLGAVASVLVVVFVGLWSWNDHGERLDQRESAERARNVELPTGNPRVHFYWVIQ